MFLLSSMLQHCAYAAHSQALITRGGRRALSVTQNSLAHALHLIWLRRAIARAQHKKNIRLHRQHCA